MDGLVPLLYVEDVPAQSALLLESRQEALEFPRGALDLAMCPACSFVENTSFDPRLVSYDKRYEGSQMCSATYGRYARDLARTLVEEFDLAGRTIVEIGCGQGEFLSMMCEITGSRGIGFDPACRTDSPDSRVTLVPRLFDASTIVDDSACILCRHTLEHVSGPACFVRMIRDAIGSRNDAIVVIEVPDVERVFERSAFQDLYYEHCSNFTRESLRHVLESNGFDILRLDRIFHDQYVLAVAGVSTHREGRMQVQRPAGRRLAIAERAGQRMAASIDRWKREIGGMVRQGDRIALWGSGSKAVAFLTATGATDVVNGIIDINPARRGRFMPGVGVAVSSPEDLPSIRPDVVIIMNAAYREEIEHAIRDRGLAPRILALE